MEQLSYGKCCQSDKISSQVIKCIVNWIKIMDMLEIDQSNDKLGLSWAKLSYSWAKLMNSSVLLSCLRGCDKTFHIILL